MTMVQVQRDVDPSYVRDELLWAIKEAIAAHPRSQQVAIGPSEIGDPCARRIGYKMLNHAELNEQVNWPATIGTAGHAWLEPAMEAQNRWLGVRRFLMEETVYVGDVAGQPIFGHCDLRDQATAGVVDWKFVGATPLRNYKANGPGRQYRAQAHLYGRGWALRGDPVDWVGIMFLPRSGELDDAVWWHEPYDEQIALDALQRATGIHLATQTLGIAALDALPTADAYCHKCPYYKAGSKDLSEGCPGDPHREVRKPGNPFPGLLITEGKKA